MSKLGSMAFMFATLACIVAIPRLTVATPSPSYLNFPNQAESTRITVAMEEADFLAVDYESKSLSNDMRLKSAYLLRFRGDAGNETNRNADDLRMELQQHFDIVLERLQKDAARSLEIALARLEKQEGTTWTAEARQMWRQHQSDQRKQNITRLTAYQNRGRFPLHEGHADGAVPIFGDNHDTACAVGHLIRCSGWNREVELIAATDLLVYVPDVEDGPLVDWVSTSGLTQEEAALIQPGYSTYAETEMRNLAGSGASLDVSAGWFDGSSTQNTSLIYENFQWGALVPSDNSSSFEWKFHTPDSPLIVPKPDEFVAADFGIRTDFESVAGEECDPPCGYGPS